MNEASGPGRRRLRRPSTAASRPRSSSGCGRRPGVGTGARPGLLLAVRAPHVPWLEPDVNDHLEALAARGEAAGVVLVPIGFVSDHMEVVYDLDTEALATAAKLGLAAVRAATPGVDPRFVAVVRDLLRRAGRGRARRGAAPARGRRPAGRGGTAARSGCCPNPRGDRPAIGGVS